MVLVQGGALTNIGNGAITVDSFYIGTYEVTWAEWQTVRAWAATHGYDIGSVGVGSAANHPVHTVNWYDCVKWCNARSQQEGRTPVYTVGGVIYKSGQINDVAVNASATGYRLPTDAQWEFAARGGTRSHGYEYSGGNDLNVVGWYWENATGATVSMHDGRGTWPVGQKTGNELGLYDMSGNVWEWCLDWYPGYKGSSRVIRGGSWVSNAYGLRSALFFPDNRRISIGFRAVLPIISRQ
jgi:formylglycine-generating enzyme required for sulfatase activity